MKLLADENLDPQVIEWLRRQGHDVLAIAEFAPGMPDLTVASVATEQARAIVTRDKDFGELVFRRALMVPGVVLIRYQSPSRAEYLATFIAQWSGIVLHLSGNFVVVTENSIRSRPL